MIVLCAGMQRSGSRWYYDLIHDLMVSAGCDDALEIRRRYELEFLREPRCNLRRLDAESLGRLDEVGRRGHTFLVKTHLRPSGALRKLLATGRFKAMYIYRDLRDVIVSGLERGAYLRRNGEATRYFVIGPYRTFARLHTVEGATLWARWQLIPRWQAWMSCRGVLTTRYEDLMADTATELRKVADHLELDVADDVLGQVVARYSRREQPARDGQDFKRPPSLNKGVIGRYREVLSPEHQALCRRRLGRFLEKMGYAV